MDSQQVDLKKMSLTELQALGYRLISEREQVQQNINVVNQEISIRYLTERPAEVNGTVDKEEILEVIK